MDKSFDSWSGLKQKLHYRHNLPTFQEREIWWCSLGVNIGHEQDGKNEMFNRPVLVIRKFNRHIFFGVPLTTQLKIDRYYFPFSFKNKMQSAMLSQVRVWDAHRLTHCIGQISNNEFDLIRQAVKDVI